MTDKSNLNFIDNDGSFQLKNPGSFSYLYFPLANSAGLMSSITPELGGDLKSGQNSFLLFPSTVEELHTSRSTRNFWVYKEGSGLWSATGVSALQKIAAYNETEENAVVTAGFLWHKVMRENKSLSLKSEITSFVPCEDDLVELSKIVITNISDEDAVITATAAVPIYGRSAENVREHRHVSSLFNRISTDEYGVTVKPTLLLNERGHLLNEMSYSVFGADSNGCPPIGFFPDIESFIGEGGTLDWPESVVKNKPAKVLEGQQIDGYEAIGALRFKTITLKPGEKVEYILALSINADDIEKKYLSSDKFDQQLEANKKYWASKLNIDFGTSDRDFNLWMKWVTCEPLLRRIYGCSFLPFHDYGKGGRGWRDLWQDCLALTLMEPDPVGEMCFKNCAGIRFDGTNATIIGSGQGEFIADRNNIVRVWMDHGAWPLNTIKFYIDQSGDIGLLLKTTTYFKDERTFFCKKTDDKWDEKSGTALLDATGKPYMGTIIEHMLIENLACFYNVGNHGMLRLENADWNDALDMAPDNGESVAFTSMYYGNLKAISSLLYELKNKLGINSLKLAKELLILLNETDSRKTETPQEKRERLLSYCKSCEHTVSGETVDVLIDDIIQNLDAKTASLSSLIVNKEKITSADGNIWLNGYYDNDSKAVEGDFKDGARMMLAGQVFAIMYGVADDELTSEIVKSADRYLFDPACGGYRLNTDFKELKLNLGRQFGFAYGHKENGAVFSHMAVMFGNALYRRGFVREGYKALMTLCDYCMDFEKSLNYPGVPEYINTRGRGMYPYLTGSASWLVLTYLTEVFGIKGSMGDLCISPKLLAQQFDSSGEAFCTTVFRDKNLRFVYHNTALLDYGQYSISAVTIDGKNVAFEKHEDALLIQSSIILALEKDKIHIIDITLQRK